MATRSTLSKVVKGLVFKKIVKEEDPNVPGALGLYMAVTSVSITPAATSVGGALQQFSGLAELADLDTGDMVIATPIGVTPGANVIVGPAGCTVAGQLAIWFAATSGTPTPSAGTWFVTVLRMG